MHSFVVTIEIEVKEGSNMLSSDPRYYGEDVADTIKHLLHDLDDTVVNNIVVEKESLHA